MNDKLISDFASRFAQAASDSPARDLEKNARALLGTLFARLDLVSREEFDAQMAVLSRARARIAELEARVAALEAARPDKPAA
jgi:hypothetical protein